MHVGDVMSKSPAPDAPLTVAAELVGLDIKFRIYTTKLWILIADTIGRNHTRCCYAPAANARGC